MRAWKESSNTLPDLETGPAWRTVGILAFDGLATLDLTGPVEALAMARHSGRQGADAQCYKTIILGLTSKRVVTESGLYFTADATIDSAGPLDTIIVPGGRGLLRGETNRRAALWLVERAEHTRRMAAVATGVYALAQSGLLDGRLVATHWRFAPDLAQRFPKLRLSQNASFVKDDRFYSSAGGTAGIEMTLALIQEDFGSVIAQKVARELVMRLRPPGDPDEPFTDSDYQCGPFERLSDLPAWIVAHLDEDLTVVALAERTGMSLRHFRRLFREVFNCAPAAFVEEMRLSEARRRLLGLSATIESVAESVGFKSPDVFCRAFERRVGMTPSAFRHRERKHDFGQGPSAPVLRRTLRQSMRPLRVG